MNIIRSSWVAEAHAGESLNVYSIWTCVQENDRNRSRSGKEAELVKLLLEDRKRRDEKLREERQERDKALVEERELRESALREERKRQDEQLQMLRKLVEGGRTEAGAGRSTCSGTTAGVREHGDLKLMKLSESDDIEAYSRGQ